MRDDGTYEVQGDRHKSHPSMNNTCSVQQSLAEQHAAQWKALFYLQQIPRVDHEDRQSRE